VYIYGKWLGYKKGVDGEPEIVPEEAAIVERIYYGYLAGKTTQMISDELRAENIVIPGKKISFSRAMIISILKNERYSGDCILQKTVTVDCISKTRKKNNGEAPMYLVENCHPAIIKREDFNKVQEEMARRLSRTPLSPQNTLTMSGKYSKYALTDVLICAECGSRYKRCTWAKNGKKRIVWRCVSRLDNGTKFCNNSPTVDEETLKRAVIRALNKFNAEDESTYLMLMKATIGDAIGLNGGSDEIDLLERRIEALNRKMLNMVTESVQSGDDVESHEADFKETADTIEQLQKRISAVRDSISKDKSYKSRLTEIQRIIDERSHHINQYDDSVVRQMIECIKVYHDGKLEVIFGGGYTVEVQMDE